LRGRGLLFEARPARVRESPELARKRSRGLFFRRFVVGIFIRGLLVLVDILVCQEPAEERDRAIF
jgi:hypothetical protein